MSYSRFCTCQICGAALRLRRGVIPPHGAQYAGQAERGRHRKRIRDACIGVSHPPLEMSRDWAMTVLENWRTRLAADEQHLADISANRVALDTLGAVDAMRLRMGIITPQIEQQQQTGAALIAAKVAARRAKFDALHALIDHPPVRVAPPEQRQIPRARVGEKFVRTRDKALYMVQDVFEILRGRPGMRFGYICLNTVSGRPRKLTSNEVHRALRKQRDTEARMESQISIPEPIQPELPPDEPETIDEVPEDVPMVGRASTLQMPDF